MLCSDTNGYNLRHIQRNPGIGMVGKEDGMGTIEQPKNCTNHPWNKGPFRGKNLVGMTDLSRQNIVLPQNTAGCQGDRTMLVQRTTSAAM